METAAHFLWCISLFFQNKIHFLLTHIVTKEDFSIFHSGWIPFFSNKFQIVENWCFSALIIIDRELGLDSFIWKNVDTLIPAGFIVQVRVMHSYWIRLTQTYRRRWKKKKKKESKLNFLCLVGRQRCRLSCFGSCT